MFCEFLPESSLEEEQPHTLLMEEVKEGHRYELVVTNASGLFRSKSRNINLIIRPFILFILFYSGSDRGIDTSQSRFALQVPNWRRCESGWLPQPVPNCRVSVQVQYACGLLLVCTFVHSISHCPGCVYVGLPAREEFQQSLFPPPAVSSQAWSDVERSRGEGFGDVVPGGSEESCCPVAGSSLGRLLLCREWHPG